MEEELKWVDVPGFEEEYKVALYRGHAIVYTKRKDRAMRLNIAYTLSKEGKQVTMGETKLLKLCGLV